MTSWTEDRRRVDEFSCTPLCLPQFNLHSIPCQVEKRMDPIHPEKKIRDDDD